MNRRGFLRAVGAAGLAMLWRGPVEGAEASSETMDSPRKKTPAPAEPKSRADKPRTKTETLIRQSIRERRVVTFRYHGFSRKAEPHALGLATEDRLAVLAWQAEGGSESEPPPGWRLFFVAEMEALMVQAEEFSRRPSYDPTKTRLKTVLAEVEK